MYAAKRVADLITFSRGMLCFALVYLGLVQGAHGLPAAVVLMLLAWMGDCLDGPIARRSPVQHQTWIGNHDLEVDMLVSLGLLGYLLASGFVDLSIGGAYLLVWALVFWQWGIQRSLGMLFQTPIYAWFLWVSLREIPIYGFLMVGWILAVIILTWPRFPQEVIPGFLAGFESLSKRSRSK